MERNTIQEMYEILDAIEQGKKIEYKSVSLEDKWADYEYKAPNFLTFRYRIKPEEPKKKWRPFRESWEFMLTALYNVHWVKSKNTGRIHLVTAIDHDGVILSHGGEGFVKWESLFKNYTTINGTPCGVEEESK